MAASRSRYARDKQERIAQVVKVSQELLERGDYASFTMNQVHKLTGIPVGTLYKDFPDGKVDVIIELARNYGDEFAGKYTNFDEETLRDFIFRSLDAGRSRRKLLIAIQMETLRDPDGFLAKTRTLTSEVDVTTFQNAMEFIAGHPVSQELLMDMLAVWKAVVRQHITFRNLYGSDERFMELMKKIIRGLGA